MTPSSGILVNLFEEEALSKAMAAIAPAGVMTRCRMIKPGDEAYLLPEEARTIRSINPSALRASGAVRTIARELLEIHGMGGVAIPRGAAGAPIWPDGLVGSLAHDDQMAVAAVASSKLFRLLGIDVEMAAPLPDELAPMVLLPDDQAGSAFPNLAGRLLFAAKEAVYKAVFPLDGIILNYDDITVNLVDGHAVTSTGRRVGLAYCAVPRIVVLAFATYAEIGRDEEEKIA